MLNVLFTIEKNLPEILKTGEANGLIKTMYIDSHPPIVERIWMPYGDLRIYLHRIHPCNESIDALFHPHPWKSAIKILSGTYEMGVGHSATNEIPKIDCKSILPTGSYYEMTEEDGWHYVNPLNGPVISLMITGERFSRKMPIEPEKKFRELTIEEKINLLNQVLILIK